MIKKDLKYYCLILSGLIILSPGNFAQTGSLPDPKGSKSNSLLLELHTLSIHVRDTITHDSVFHFLVDKLKLPVYYYPIRYGMRKYAGVYAGNLVLEPCGPYSNFSYASIEFRAIFFGLTFESGNSMSSVSMGLTEREISHEAGEDYIYLKDSPLCGDNITISFMDKGQDKINDIRKLDSLRYNLTTDSENKLGIEYVKEIQIGYKDSINLQKWKELICPEELKDNKIWNASNILEFHFIKSNIKEVQSITFKVKSLEKAKRYLLDNNLVGNYSDNKIELDKNQTFGLSVYLTETD
jgi:hypothetical protein